MAVKCANIGVRVEPDIKAQAEKILEGLGVSASAFINMAYRQVILHNGIPFAVVFPKRIGNREEMTDEEFDNMLEDSLKQAKLGNAVAVEEAFASLRKGL